MDNVSAKYKNKNYDLSIMRLVTVLYYHYLSKESVKDKLVIPAWCGMVSLPIKTVLGGNKSNYPPVI